jgi:peroxiredoxin
VFHFSSVFKKFIKVDLVSESIVFQRSNFCSNTEITSSGVRLLSKIQAVFGENEAVVIG